MITNSSERLGADVSPENDLAQDGWSELKGKNSNKNLLLVIFGTVHRTKASEVAV